MLKFFCFTGDYKQLTVAVFGKNAQLKNDIGNKILCEDRFTTLTNDFSAQENDSYKVITTPDVFDEECPNPDQQIIDFMALSYPGLNLFILAIDSENTEEENVVKQITKLLYSFGEEITAHLAVMLPDTRSRSSLNHLDEWFKIRLVMADENLSSGCKNWCSHLGLFKFNYKHYSEDVVTRRREALNNTRCNGRSRVLPEGADPDTLGLSMSQQDCARPAAATHFSGNEAIDNAFNVVLLGLSGTGKSASGNTILDAGIWDQHPLQRFKSEPSSMPVTTQCDIRKVKLLGRSVRVVDTPDFFSDQLRNSEAQVAECKRYSQPGQCVVLLVMQLNRVTESEDRIVEKLEEKLGWKIRTNTIVLLTHGEDLKGSLQEFVNESPRLRNIVGMCGNRIHVFRNNLQTTKGHKQVKELIEKIPQYESDFPDLTIHKPTMQCCVLG
ncbi:uncharacterized protein V6R79_026318 [Siganus canaliculatus]